MYHPLRLCIMPRQIAIHGRPLSTPHSSPVVSHARVNSKLCHIVRLRHALARKSDRLFHNTLVGVEADVELLAVLVGSVIGKHLAARGALERLEAGFALDGLGVGVLAFC